MKLAVITNEAMQEAFFHKKFEGSAEVCIVKTPQSVPSDSYITFDLLFGHTPARISLLKQFLPRLVFINEVTQTLALINEPFVRINAWPTFLKRDILEVAALPAQEKILPAIFKTLSWKYQLVPDFTGMISARILGMIVNEAYYTFEEGVGTKPTIDITMKMGANYPYGPFEWSEKIGIKKIYTMLHQLSKENNLYQVSTLLTNEANLQ